MIAWLIIHAIPIPNNSILINKKLNNKIVNAPNTPIPIKSFTLFCTLKTVPHILFIAIKMPEIAISCKSLKASEE